MFHPFLSGRVLLRRRLHGGGPGPDRPRGEAGAGAGGGGGGGDGVGRPGELVDGE